MIAETARAGHEDFAIGQSGSPLFQLEIRGTNTHSVDLLAGADFILLTPGTGAYTGYYVNDQPGWASTLVDDPPTFFQLQPGHKTALERRDFSPGFMMFNASAGGPGSGGDILENDLDAFQFLPRDINGDFHNDLLFGAGPTAQAGDTFSATFRLIDLNAEEIHAPSEEFTLLFKVEPEPGTLGLLGLGVAALLRRRRA